ncbi:MAG: 3-phosphoglycerate dehydrogenase, partial [Lachnospiraceae bacterium]|nr:3-phosphoglycerate dehydrogenase [Lachnospiraceae bacterium]
MFGYHCLNPISEVGTTRFTELYEERKNPEDADGILVRSASMHDMEFSEKLLCIARAGAGVNNIPL